MIQPDAAINLSAFLANLEDNLVYGFAFLFLFAIGLGMAKVTVDVLNGIFRKKQ